jgi:hypothetical protein
MLINYDYNSIFFRLMFDILKMSDKISVEELIAKIDVPTQPEQNVASEPVSESRIQKNKKNIIRLLKFILKIVIAYYISGIPTFREYILMKTGIYSPLHRIGLFGLSLAAVFGIDRLISQ